MRLAASTLEQQKEGKVLFVYGLVIVFEFYLDLYEIFTHTKCENPYVLVCSTDLNTVLNRLN